MATVFKEFGMVDYLAFGTAAFLVIRGFVRGGSDEIGNLVGVVTAAAVGYFGFTPVARLVLTANVFHANPYAGRLIVFILLSVVCIALWLGLRRILTYTLRLAIAQPFDTLLGGVIGGVKAFILVAVLCTLGLLNPREQARTQFQQHSLTAQKLAPLLKSITSPDT
ncbi:MAG: CvpA family protein [bacterium]